MGSTCCHTKFQSSSYGKMMKLSIAELCLEQGSSALVLQKQSVSQQEQSQMVAPLPLPLLGKESQTPSKLEAMKQQIQILQLESIKAGSDQMEEQVNTPNGEIKLSRNISIESEQLNINNKDIRSTNQQETNLLQLSPIQLDSAMNLPQQSPSPLKKNGQRKESLTVEQYNNTTFTSPRIKTTNRQIQDQSASPTKKSIGSMSSLTVRMGIELFVNLKKASINKVYTFGQVLGQGAFGKVWKVTHKTTGLIRAMKQIKKSELIKEDEQKLFQEMHILKNLDHPHIVKLYELYQDQNNYYMITEYLSGGELFERIKKMQVFTEKRASELIRQILLAINYCHDQKIVHRDLKPENVLFSGPEPDLNLKIIDFGCSRRFNTSKMTKRLGTPYYIAPEVLGHNYTEKCDIWSCGVILYILLCGYPPFTGKTEQEIFEKVKLGRLKFPNEEWEFVSKEAKHLIQKMIQVDVNLRYSAPQALNDPWFQKHATNQPINKKVLDNLSQFQATSEFRTAIVQYIISQMTNHKEIEDLQHTFQSLDVNRDGVLSKEELIQGYKRIMKNQEQAEQQAERILEEIDKNFSGQIDYSEFIMASINQSKILSQKKIEQAFRIFDLDGDGYITKQEVEDVMGTLNQDVWQLFLQETDHNQDGKISYQEFLKLFSK
ncbi:unnamed protein product (macronuclear) [Paramecium tetraurelia]|uniref:Calcium-dependent protein kinase 1 n=1 Tax=Paramecium tetraurelia TaxID=5888 RepID=A0E864_PARTE|nr:uncharacterized protein GSPATT00024209001 [Paramecium tetraurelia]CAK91481.1 unnamed protein product [Paramecium tetraurelia]|eukprot:XP_001458878.1 hypothetical protein (macronuclear) [Paramecium tetraurelia strain d4-2]